MCCDSKKMRLLTLVVVSVALLNSFVFSQLEIGDACVTPYKEDGVCIFRDHCQPFADYMKNQNNKPLSDSAIKYLRESTCGFFDNQHYICCSNRHTTTSTTPTTTTEAPSVPEFGRIEDVSNHPNLNLLPRSCGSISDDRIANGQNTSINELPFMALLRYETAQGLEFACGGTIINERYILTAAHCVTYPTRKLVSVRVGEHVISTADDCETFFKKTVCAPAVDDIEVEEIRFYPRYNRPRFGNDIAVVRLRRAINLNNSNMGAVCLPIDNPNQYPSLVNLSTAGWGFTEFNTASDVLLKARLPIVDRGSCQTQYVGTQILESQLCAGGVNKTDTCQGDSGGPVFSPGRIYNSIRYVQYGIVAAGHASCGGDDNFPGIYTNIAYYIKWILDQLR